MTKIVSNRKVIVPAAVALAAVVAIAVAAPAAPQQAALAVASATGQAATGMGSGWHGNATGNMPKINGTVNVGQQMKNFINDNLKVTLAQASDTAAKQVAGGKGIVVSGNLGVVQGYLVYKLHVVNPTDQTAQMVIVDAGNGQVLYTSPSMQMGAFGAPMFGGHEGHGWKGHGFGGGW
jgi:uncharacterized membrane protein YkoI